ncbi:MAG: GNAT family N-acetyltransferase [Pseudohongiella sp.]|uniref:GNAT family N-acetyltransferase n=1 Tax=Pseudohongiella sp. TaxID=1979412 RepID=UPI0034A081B6
MVSDNAIELLDHKDTATAVSIWAIFQESYKVEAKLLAVRNFPPLARTAKSIQHADTVFYCYRLQNHKIAGIVEVDNELDVDGLSISSLVVRPELFRHGIASKLVRHVLQLAVHRTVIVHTAKLNTPATSLYKKIGFIEKQSWESAEGITLIRLEMET